MIELGPATENEMVLAFLQAEIDSPRFGLAYPTFFDQVNRFGITRQTLLENADLNSQRDNALRTQLLGVLRGYRRNSLLFAGFPDDVRWRRVGLQSDDWEKVRYARERSWIDLSGGTRRVLDGANHIDISQIGNPNDHIRAIASDLRNGKRYPPLIGVENDEGEIILAEGHCRATACAITRPRHGIECIVGKSPSFGNWRYY
jgi:hypothetical protein